MSLYDLFVVKDCQVDDLDSLFSFRRLGQGR